MNITSVNCFAVIFRFEVLSHRQFAILTAVSLFVMVVNLITNTLVIYALIKTKQIGNVTSKLILMLSVSDLMVALFCQTFQTTTFYTRDCIVMGSYQFITVLFVHVSMYTIAIIGIDRYLRIKYFASFKALWTTRVVLTLISLAIFLALLQAIMTTIGILLGREDITLSIYSLMNGAIFGSVVFLQILTIRRSNVIHNESSIAASATANKKITKFSMRIMLLLCAFIIPHQVILGLRSSIWDELNDYGKSAVQFIVALSVIMLFSNSAANAILYLTTNIKARRLLRSLCH